MTVKTKGITLNTPVNSYAKTVTALLIFFIKNILTANMRP